MSQPTMIQDTYLTPILLRPTPQRRFLARNKYGDWFVYVLEKETAHYVTGHNKFSGEPIKCRKTSIRWEEA